MIMVREDTKYISPCGKYLAILTPNNHELEIYKIKNSMLHRKINIMSIIQLHITEYHIGIKESALRVTQISWEEIKVNASTTKIGILVENYSLLIIIDIRSDTIDPMVIQQNHIDGIYKFEWIPPTDTENEPESGAYINCKQLMMFSHHNLQAKLFSLDCTSVIFTILKPATSKIYIRPNRRNTIWSLTAFSLDYSSSLIMYLFYNTGSVSIPLHEYKLSQSMVSDFDMNWSKSGSWISFMNTSENIFGFNLKIFNSLGIHVIKNEEARESIRMGGPILNLDWKTEGINDDSSTSSISTSSPNYISRWIEFDNLEYLLIGSMPSQLEIELLLISLNSLSIENKTKLKVNGFTNNWVQTSDRGNIKYRKYTNMSNQSLKLDFKDILVSENYILFNYGDSFLFSEFSLNKNPEKNIYDSNIFVSFTSTIRKYKFIKNSATLLIVAANHLALLDIKKNKIEVIFTSKLTIRDALPFQDDTVIGVLLGDPNTDEHQLGNWEFIKVPEILYNVENNTEFESIKVYEDKEDSPKVLGLINDANRLDSARSRRNRFSLFNSNTDEITDTFNLIKRQKNK